MARPDHPPPPSGAASANCGGIFRKLIAAQMGLLGVVVVCLLIYVPTREVSAAQDRLEDKIISYGALVAHELRPAIAFDDVETAREAFDAVGQDAALEGMFIHRANGEQLFGVGAPSTFVASKVASVPRRRMLIRTPDRLVLIAPVVSREGPRGTLVLEVSTASIFAARRESIAMALVMAFGVLALGSAVSWLVARSFSRRIRTLAAGVRAVASGQLGHRMIPDTGRDELGELSLGVTKMVDQLRHLLGHIKSQAAADHDRLERQVRERTRALDERNDELRRVLNNTDQGFVVVNANGTMSQERSAALADWFGESPESDDFADYIEQIDEDAGEWMRMAWEAMSEGILPLSLALDQLPRELVANGRIFGLGYKPILNGGDPYVEDRFDSVLVIITDQTSKMAVEQAESNQRELMSLVGRALADRIGFLEFTEEAGAIVETLQEGAVDRTQSKRLLHTLKGTSAIVGAETISALCHDLEDRMEREPETLPPEALQPLVQRWTDLSASLGQLADARRHGLIEVDEDEYDKVLSTLQGGVRRDLLVRRLEGWRLEPTKKRLERIGEQALALATRLGKDPVSLVIADHGLRLPADEWSDFWSAFVHAVRNAVDHGLETPEERKLKGKSAGRLTLRTLREGGLFIVELEDSGRGIDWSAIRRKAEEAGLAAERESDLVEALFADGLSTAEQVTSVSGRGVGMASLRDAVTRRNGRVEVVSKRGEGTCFRFIWRDSVLPPASEHVSLRPGKWSVSPTSGLVRLAT